MKRQQTDVTMYDRHDPLNATSLRDNAKVAILCDGSVIVWRKDRNRDEGAYMKPSPTTRAMIDKLVNGRFWTNRFEHDGLVVVYTESEQQTKMMQWVRRYGFDATLTDNGNIRVSLTNRSVDVAEVSHETHLRDEYMMQDGRGVIILVNLKDEHEAATS